MSDEKKILEALRTDPAVIAALDRQKAETAERRKEAGNRLRAITQEAAESLPALRAAVADAEKAVKDYDAGRKPLINALNEARALHWTESLRFTQAKDAAGAILNETAPEEIAEAIQHLDALFWELRKRTPNEQTQRDGFDVLHMKQKLRTFSNSPSIGAAMTYCKEAMRELQEAKTDPDFSLDRIEELKKGVPDPTTLVEFSGERGVKDASDVGATDLLPSDSFLDWTMSKLEEKHEQWKRGKLK